jgi:uncharacterized protein (TIGR02145 family)
MKQFFFFFFAMLASITASATVTVTPISTDYATQKITFKVAWNSAPYNNRVWVWVDFCPVTGTVPATSFSTATVSNPTITGGNGSTATPTARGFFIVYSSATNAGTTVTATLNNAPAGKFNWCAYGSDAPPRMLYLNSGTLTLGGTPPFVISDASGANTYTIPAGAKTVTLATLLAAVPVPAYITDKTDCKGTLRLDNTVLQGNCTFTQPSLVYGFSTFPADYSASTFVSLIDERDLNIYTAVKIGGRWWMGQNLNYQQGLTYFSKHSSPTTATGSQYQLRGGFWCPANDLNDTPVSVCDYWGALYPWETAMLLDGKGTWTEVSGSYCTGAANTAPCKTNFGRKASSGTAIGGRGICPPNWHVPTDFELGELMDAMESSPSTVHQTVSANDVWVGTDAGTRAKATCGGTSSNTNPLWDSGAGSDAFNFRVIASDDRNGDGSIDSVRGLYAIFWSSAAHSGGAGTQRSVNYANANVRRVQGNRSYGFSVRCIRD